MTIGKPARFRWTALALSIAAACSATAQAATPAVAHAPGSAADAPVGPSRHGAEPESLFLEVVLNGVNLRLLGYFQHEGGRLYATGGTLRGLGLAWPGHDDAQAPVALDDLAGVRYRYDVRAQRLHLDVPVAMLAAPPTRIGHRDPPVPRLDPATRAPGLLLNYSAWAQDDGDRGSLSAWQELRLFGAGPGVWRTSALASRSRGDGGRHALVRLDTSWQLDFPGPRISVVLGDTHGSGLEWVRSTRFGGIRVSRNFGLQPYRPTIPLASFAGEAVLPSTVELFIDGVRRASQPVPPGRFQIDAVPVISGVGHAQVVLTDVTGASQVVDFTLYHDRQLLQRGLADWSLEAGRLRRDHGLRSSAYASSVFTGATLRYGAGDGLTLEAHAQGGDGLAMGGAGAFLRLGRAGGVLDASWARSRHGDGGRRGVQRGLGYHWRNRRLSLGVASLRRDPGFADVASLEGAPMPLRSERAFVGLDTGAGQFGAGHVRQRLPGGEQSRYATLNWSRQLRRDGSLGLGVSRDLAGAGGTSAYLHLALALGRDRQAWIGVQRQDHGDQLTVGAVRPLPLDAGGWGWRAQASVGDRGGGQAEIAQATRFGQWSLGARAWHHGDDTSTTGYFGMAGGVLWMRGGLYPMRRAYDAFALVSTDGIAGVPVQLENRPVGSTDARGLLLVVPLNAWHHNRLSIDPAGLPAHVSVERLRLEAVPATASGMLARFPMRAVAMVALSLRGPDGDWVPAGAPLELLDAAGHAVPVASVGFDGQVFLEDPPAGARLRATLPQGQCMATLPAPMPAQGWVQAGELACR